MRKSMQIVSLLMTVIGMTLMTEKQAHAYADPGSSLLILQTVGSILTATGLYFRRRIAAFFGKSQSNPTDRSAIDSSSSIPSE
jgi:hypothetical protein